MIHFSKAAIGNVLAIGAYLLVSTIPAQAQSFPAKPIRIIGIATAGSPSDVIGRATAEVLSRQMNAHASG